MLANDVKKGMPLHFNDGTKGFMNDNRKGVIRQMRYMTPFGTEGIGDRYIFDITAADVGDNDWEAVEFSASQLKQRETINAVIGL